MTDDGRIDPWTAAELARRVRDAVVTEVPRHGRRDLALFVGLVVAVITIVVVLV